MANNHPEEFVSVGGVVDLAHQNESWQAGVLMTEPGKPQGKSGDQGSVKPSRRTGKRKPINEDLPDPVKGLLLNLEELADGRRISFPRMTELIYEGGGERLNPANITRWRNGTEFPTEEAVRRWTRVCGGNEPTVMRKFSTARIAYLGWRKDGRQPPAPAPPVVTNHRRTVWFIAAAGALLLLLVAALASQHDRAAEDDFVTAVGTCQWRSRTIPPVTQTAPAGATVYKLSSGAGSRDIPVLQGGSVLQPFLATGPSISEVAAIIGLDGKRTDILVPHPVLFEIIDPRRTASETVIGRQESSVTTSNANRDVVAAFGSPIRVTTGSIYVLRVVNLSQATIGFYVNGRDGPDRSVPYGVDVCVQNAAGPFTSVGWSMSGFVITAG